MIRPPRLLLTASVLVTLWVGTGVTRSAAAFSGTDHLTITEEILRNLGFGACAINRIVAGNLLTDKPPIGGDVDQHREWFNPEAHFDNELFSKGSARLNSLLDAAVNHAKKQDWHAAYLDIGGALHGIQDFFSHSNAGVVKHHAAIELLSIQDPSPADRAVAVNCGTGVGPLTSGYYQYKQADIDAGRAPVVTTPTGRCTHAQLSKDKEDAVGHKHAIEQATQASTDFMNHVKTRIEALPGGTQLYDSLRVYDDGSPLQVFDDLVDGH